MRHGAFLAGAALLLLWLAWGADRPWCLDDGLRLLAASGPAVERVAELDAVVNTGPAAPVLPDQLERTTFPVVQPFVHWEGGRPLLVFPPLYLTLLWMASRLGAAGPVLLALLTGLLVAWAARRFLRREGLAGHRPASGWLVGLLASPVLFYLGTSWEIGLTTALLLLLLQERRDPLPIAASPLYGLLPWLRPEAVLLWAGGLLLLRGWRRRLLSASGFLAGALLHRWLTGSWIGLQMMENWGHRPLNPLTNLAAFWLPAPAGPWLWAGLAVLATLIASQWRDTRVQVVAALMWVGLAGAFAAMQRNGDHQLLPCWGALLTAPAAVALLARWAAGRGWRGIAPEAALLSGYLLIVSLASPVDLGFHWGPRLHVPALVPLSLWYLTRGPSGWPRRLGLGLALSAQLISLLLLNGRRQLVAEQDVVLAGLSAPALVTSELYLLGDHPWLARGRLVHLPWGEAPARALIPALRQRGVREIDLLTPPGHPLPVYLGEVLGLRPDPAFRLIPGSRLGQAQEWRRLTLPD